jgi:hypothetical protein
MVYRNGVLLNTELASPSSLYYEETSTTTITLDLAAAITDVFLVMIAGVAPQFREVLTGVTGTVLTIPNSETYAIGNQRLLVFRNGVLMLNSTTLATPTSRYQETATDEVTIEEAAVASDVFEFLYI